MITVWTRPTHAKRPQTNDLVLAPDVTLVLADDGTARLMDMGGSFFALSAIGAQMLQSTLEQGRAATIEALAQRYQISSDRIRGDFHALLQQLLQQGLLRPAGGRHQSHFVGLALILVPCLSLIRSLSFGWLRAALTLTLAKLAIACFGWARTVSVWQRHLFRQSTRHSTLVNEQEVRALDHALRQVAASHPLSMACKERALSCWTLLRWAGVAATLVVGLELFPLGGHCWCEAGPWVLSDYDDNCALYTPVIRYEVLS